VVTLAHFCSHLSELSSEHFFAAIGSVLTGVKTLPSHGQYLATAQLRDTDGDYTDGDFETSVVWNGRVKGCGHETTSIEIGIAASNHSRGCGWPWGSEEVPTMSLMPRIP
jgi:hypothetical protein